MAATLAAAIFGSGRDLVCSPVLSPREGRFAYLTHVLGGMRMPDGLRSPPPAATCADIAWDHARVGGPRGRGGGLSRLRKRRQR